MNYLEYYKDVPSLLVQDPLSALLGCPDQGRIEYTYEDVVKLLGHACPTTATAFWLTRLALEALYPDCLPQRGGIKVELREAPDSANAGAVASVVEMLTGAGGRHGFRGFNAQYCRAGLLKYNPALLLFMRFTRLDTGDAVEVTADLGLDPVDPRVQRLLVRCMEGAATDEERSRLADAWHSRIRHVLVDLGKDPAVFVIRPVPAAAPATPSRRVAQ